MSSPVNIRYVVAAAALAAMLGGGAAQANDKVTFRDVLRPHGQARSSAQQIADGHACGTSAGGTLEVILPVFERCMRRKGWVLARYDADPATVPTSGTNLGYTDTRGNGHAQPRDDAILQSDTQACGGGRRDEQSAGFKRCMAAHGWRYMYAQRAPAPPRSRWAGSWSSSSSSSSSADDSVRRDDDIRRIDESNRMMQSISDQAVDNTNAVNAQQAADQAQQNANAAIVVNPQ